MASGGWDERGVRECGLCEMGLMKVPWFCFRGFLVSGLTNGPKKVYVCVFYHVFVLFKCRVDTDQIKIGSNSAKQRNDGTEDL